MTNLHIMFAKWKELPLFFKEKCSVEQDWLVSSIDCEAKVYRTEKEGRIILTNGLCSRSFTLFPNGATIGLDNLASNETLLRGVKSEARVTLNGKEFEIGGLKGQVEYAYLLPEWIDTFSNNPESFQLTNFSIHPIQKRFEWKKARHCENRPWPPKGIELILEYIPPKSSASELEGIIIRIHYECYQGIPLFSKWITIENKSKQSVHLNSFVNEILALVEFIAVTPQGTTPVKNPNFHPSIYFESDMAYGWMDADGANKITHWKIDKQFSSQVDYLSTSLNLMESYVELGPDVDILPNSTFEGFRDFQLIESSYDHQRKGLARCQMYRTIAPWITENPLMMHLTVMDPAIVKPAVKQMAEVGFEMLIFSFGSSFSSSVLELEVEHPDWFEEMLPEVKEDLINQIHATRIEVGGYSLLASRKISNDDDVVNPLTGKTSDIQSPQLEPGIEAIQGIDSKTSSIQGAPTFGNSPCLGSKWGLKYFDSLRKAIEILDLNILEHDGSYPGDVCGSTKHPGHKGLGDSQWTQWKVITDFYKWCRSRGVFLNVPDWYMLTGSNKTGIGYKEVNWSLPRDRQVMLGRQNIYDGTWEKTPTMGWTFCPLTPYHSVKEYPTEVAKLEPLSEHLSHYEAHLAQNLGSGVQACYRGTRLYDTEKTKELVMKYVNWYKQYRDILNSDIVHIRRPDGRNIDGIIHVNPRLNIRGLAMFYNPTNDPISESIKIPLYYTGLTEKTIIKEKGANPQIGTLSRDFTISYTVTIPANSHTWITFEQS